MLVGGSQNKIVTLIVILVIVTGGFLAYERFTGAFRLGRLQKEAALLSQLQEVQARATNALTPELIQLKGTLFTNASKTINEDRFSLNFVPSKLNFSFDSLWKFLAGGILWWGIGLYFFFKKKTPDYHNTVWGYAIFAVLSGIASLFVPAVWWPWFHIFIFPWLFIISLLVALTPFLIVITNFQKARKTAAANGCINNLRQLDAAANQWALEHSKSIGAIPTEGDLLPYLAGSVLPKCPSGGVYKINTFGTSPVCSEKGHNL